MAKRGSKAWQENIRRGVEKAWKKGKFKNVDYTHSIAHREKLSAWRTGKTYEEIYGKKEAKVMREMRQQQMTGNQHLLGKHWALSPVQRQKHSIPRTPDQRKNYALSKMGEKNPAFNNWSSYTPYTPEFNKELKQRIKEREGGICAFCNKSAPNGCPHHIDYIKENCALDNLVWVCCSCNSKFNTQREFWKKYWKNYLIVTGKAQIFPKVLNNNNEKDSSNG